MKKPLIIVGIDPGTTTAFSILDMNGKLIKKGSSKNLGLSKLISIIVGYGDVVLVGTDKKKCPGLVESFAVKMGARIVKPEEDLLISEKKHLLNGIKAKNSHEADAIASAVFAHRSFMPLIKRINSFVSIKKKDEMSDQVKKIVILKGISISDALKIAEKHEEKDDSKKEYAKYERIVKSDEYGIIRDKLTEANNKNRFLASQNYELKKLLRKSENDIKMLEKKVTGFVDDKKAKKILGFREQRILSLAEELSQKNREIEKLQEEIFETNRMVAGSEDEVIAKRLENLGNEEFMKKSKFLTIKKDDLIMVDDPNIFSERVAGFFSGRNEVIISKKIPNRILGEKFIFIDSEKLRFRESRLFALVSRDDLERQKKKINLLSRVVEEYKKTRLK